MSHQLRVLRLYRRALKDSKSWCVDRALWYEHATVLRAKFDAHKDEKNVITSKKLLEAGEAELEANKHPDPYKPCTSLDGSKWERNIPPPDFIVQQSAEQYPNAS